MLNNLGWAPGKRSGGARLGAGGSIDDLRTQLDQNLRGIVGIIANADGQAIGLEDDAVLTHLERDAHPRFPTSVGSIEPGVWRIYLSWFMENNFRPRFLPSAFRLLNLARLFPHPPFEPPVWRDTR